MTHVIGLSRGWSVCRDSITGRPWFKRRGHAITPHDFSAMPEARDVFRDVKRELDKKDMALVRLDDMDFRALDMAKFALQMALGVRGRWSPELLETGVIERVQSGG